MTKTVSTIVIYCNPIDQIKTVLACCASITGNTVFVVDNSPTNKFQELCLSFGAQYIHTPSNPGFGASHNLAKEKFPDYDTYLIVNPDVHFSSDDAIKLIDFINKNHDVVCVVPKVIYPDGQLQRLCKLLPSPLNLFVRRFAKKLADKLDNNFELRWFSYNVAVAIPYASGCFMAVRAEIFRKIGGFDERFFMYLEDTDLSRRLSQHGKIIFYPDAIITHEFAKASYKNKRLLLVHIKSAVQYFNKWGWFFDRERNQINSEAVAKIRAVMAEAKTANPKCTESSSR
ncbi:glycosyltransferase [Vogesella facilis]|uniref:Glycosyltransferase n=1 Tax=Vogesella facilis TaxID=1655232 RepID=A0ABV7RHV4_9NEIS